MSHEGFLEKNRSGKGRHRKELPKDAIENEEVFSLATPDAEAPGSSTIEGGAEEEVTLSFKPLNEAGAKYVRSIPFDVDFDTTDFPPEMIAFLGRRGLRITRRDRKGGSHITVTDGTSEVRLSHSDLIQILREDLKEYEENAERLAEIEAIERSLSTAAPASPIENITEEMPESPSSVPDVDTTNVINPFLQPREEEESSDEVTLTSTDEAQVKETSKYPIFVAEPEQAVSTEVDPFDALNRDFSRPTAVESPPEKKKQSETPSLPKDALKAMDDMKKKNRTELKRIPELESQWITFDQRFFHEFNITREDLESIDGFDTLTVPQQKLLFENLSQSVYGRVQEEAQERVKADAKERQALSTDAKLWKKAWIGIREGLSKDFNLLKAEKDIAIAHKEAGFEEHKETLEFLVKSMARSGPRVHETPGGELQVDVVNIREWPKGVERKNQKFAAQAVNQAAHAFAKIPASWKEETLGVTEGKENEWKLTSYFKEKFFTDRKRGNEFNEKEATYNKAKEDLATSLRNSGASEVEIVRTLIDIDYKVKQLQFIQTDPGAVEELCNIEDKNVWYGAVKSLVTRPGSISFALGFATRSVLSAIPSVIAAPLVSSAIAGVRSWNKTAAELREKDRLARMGVIDTSSEALNIVKAGGPHGLIAKTDSLLRSYYSLEAKQAAAFRDGDAEVQEELEAEMQKVLSRLRARVKYTEDKEGLQRVDYGSGTYSYLQHAHLLQLLGEAALIVEDANAPMNERLMSRLERVLDTKDESIRQQRQSYRRRDLKKQIGKAVAFSLAGVALSHITQAVAGEFGGRLRVSQDPSLPRTTSPTTTIPNAGGGPQIAQTPPAPSSGVLPDSVREAHAQVEISPKSYEIVKGDSLTKIFTEKIPLYNTQTGEALSQTDVLRLLKSLSKEELARIGVGEDINKIYTGKSLDIDELSKVLNEHTDFFTSSTLTDATSSTEDLGDFRGAEFEKDSDILNKESVIREREVTIPDVRGMSNEYPSGGFRTPMSETVTESIDPITQKKAEILQQYLIAQNIPGVEWNKMANASANAYKELKTSEMSDPYQKFVHDIFVGVEKPPLKMTPQRGDTVERFMKRIFTEIAKRGTDSDYPPGLKSLLNGGIKKRWDA